MGSVAWGSSWGAAWGNSWGASAGAATTEVGGGKPWRQKWRQELVQLLDRRFPDSPKVPAKVTKAIQRVLEKAPPDDSGAIQALRGELDKLNAPCKPLYVRALRVEALKRFDNEEEVILLLLH